ncbi:MAG: hypothetical protein ACYC36_02615 [Bellilinea sp.]
MKICCQCGIENIEVWCCKSGFVSSYMQGECQMCGANTLVTASSDFGIYGFITKAEYDQNQRDQERADLLEDKYRDED